MVNFEKVPGERYKRFLVLYSESKLYKTDDQTGKKTLHYVHYGIHANRTR